MKKLILGSGKVSQIFYSLDPDNTRVVPRTECDITEYDEVLSALRRYSPEVVINCAAKTNLEYCEEEKALALCVNTLGPVNVINACNNLKIKLVHISSGCLFDGNDKMSTEDSEPTPSVWYTWTKKWADEALLSHKYDNVLILRPRQLVSKEVHPSNLITKFLGFDEITAIDEENSITCIEDLYEMMEHLLAKKETGVFNCANSGITTPYEISLMIKERLKPEIKVTKVKYEELLEKMPNRRVNTILSIEKLVASGYMPRHAKDAVMWCLENYDK